MDLQYLPLTTLLFYGIAGLLAGGSASRILLGRGFGLLANTAIGIVGAFLGAEALQLIGAAPLRSHIGLFVMAFVGALVLVFLIGLARRLVAAPAAFQPVAPPRRRY